MPSVVLVTGAGGYLGGRVVSDLAADPSVRRVIAVDSAPVLRTRSGRGDRVDYLRADIRNPLIAGVLTAARVDTVLHLGAAAPTRDARRPGEPRVPGTLQLLAACQRTPTVRCFVLASTTAVYGSGARNPVGYTERARPARTPGPGARLAIEVENHTRGFARRRPDVAVTVLRLAGVVGPGVPDGLTRYLALPAVPTVLGYDPRLQVLHADDAVAALAHAVTRPRAGTVNVAGTGAVPLSQVLRWAGRVRLPLLPRAVRAVLRDVVDLGDEDERFLMYGRVVDTTVLTEEVGLRCRHPTATALREAVAAAPALPRVGIAALGAVEAALRSRSSEPTTTVTR